MPALAVVADGLDGLGVAAEEGVGFIDLNSRIADRYDAAGVEAVNAYFADESTHTSLAGAELNASIVVEGLKTVAANPFAGYVAPAIPAAATAQTP